MATPEAQPADDQVMRDLHTLLLETEVREGKMVCGNCGHEYKIMEGIANFLLPSHLGKFSSVLYEKFGIMWLAQLDEEESNLGYEC